MRIPLACLLLAGSVATVSAQQAPETTDANYHARYGRAEMNISCKPAARAPFERGLLQLHSFAWNTSRASFEDAIKADPDCAIAWWGVAMSYYDGLHGHPPAKDVEAARTALANAMKAKTQSERETAYISAAGQIFTGYPEVERIVRDQNYNEAMEKLYRAWPDDDEAAAFYSLSLLSLARRRANDQTLQMQAAQILEPLLKKLPDHPGIAHYLIHAYDDAGIREPGLEAARRYAPIAPVLTHAQHMPAHIFAGLGMWEDSNHSNANALEADPASYHALMYLVYGELQLGQRKQAAARVKKLQDFSHSDQGNRAARRGLHQVNTWLLLETRDWRAAAAAPAHSDMTEDMLDTFYVRGIGAVRLGDTATAMTALSALKDLLGKIEQAPRNHDPVRIRLARVQIKQIESLLQLAGGHENEAVALMQQAAELADDPGINRAQPDAGTGLPTHEIYGELLYQLGRYQEAIRQFELALQRTPNRLYSLLGLARAADALGDQAAARTHYRDILQLLAKADTGLPELAEARKYIDTN